MEKKPKRILPLNRVSLSIVLAKLKGPTYIKRVKLKNKNTHKETSLQATALFIHSIHTTSTGITTNNNNQSVKYKNRIKKLKTFI